MAERRSGAIASRIYRRGFKRLPGINTTNATREVPCQSTSSADYGHISPSSPAHSTNSEGWELELSHDATRSLCRGELQVNVGHLKDRQLINYLGFDSSSCGGDSPCLQSAAEFLFGMCLFVAEQFVVDGEPRPRPLINCEAQTNHPTLDPDKLNALHRRILYLLSPANMLRTATTNRSRAAIRERMVRHHRDMPGHDHIPR